MMYRPLGATVAALLLLCRAVEAASLPEAEVANATVLAGAGDPMRVITLTAPDNSIVANFLSTGATLKNLWVKDRRGKFRDIVLGYDKKSLYASDPSHPFFGGIVGRYANRIKNGTFSIPITKNATGPDVYTIPTNENGGLDTLHGGLVGYDRRNWGPMNLSKSSVTYHLIDPDGTQGFPGTVQALVTYTLMKQAKWKIEMFANSTKKTPILLSSHEPGSVPRDQSLADHELQIEASRVIATDGILVPTGELTNVTGTYFDFRNETRLGDVIDKAVGYCGTGCTGLDNAWIYDRSAEKTPAFSLYSPNSGIKMSVTTDQPALQVYTCNGIANNGDGKNVTIPRKKAHGGPKKYYPNHSCAVIEQLVLACYPSNPLAAAPEFKPNAQELSKLSYYATNRAGKLTKLADVFEKRATDEARRAGFLAHHPRHTQTAGHDCKRDLTLLSTALIASVKASLVALPDDLEVAARAASVFTAWTAYTDGTLIGVDNAFTNNYLATLSMFAKLCQSNGINGDSENRNRTRIVGLGAISGAVTSAALFHSLSEFQHQVDAIVPPILFNIHSHELERLNEECEIIDAPNGPSSPFLTEFQPQRPLANRKAASIHAHIDGEKGPSKSDVLDLSLRDLKALFSPSNPAQLGHVMQAIFHHVDNAQLWPNVEWCCWLVDRVTDWAQFPYRFVIPTRLIELLVSVRDEAVPTAQHTTLVATITTVLSSPKHIINLSTGEVAANLIQVVLRRAAIDPMDGLLPALVTCTAALGTHIYYSDQIQDLSEEIINRIAIRCLVACLVGLIKATELNKGRITSHAHKEEVAPTEKGKWRASVDGAASDAEKLAVITSSGRRNPISPESGRKRIMPVPWRRTFVPSCRPSHTALKTSGRQSQFTDATYRFLNALHASAYTLAISAALGLSTDPLAGASQASSSQALAPTPINIVPATPVGTPKHEIPPPVISEEGSKRTPSTSSGYRPPSPSDYAHLINVLCAMHERLPVRGLFAGVPMLLALDQAASSIGDNDGNNARGRKQAAREVIAQAWITIGKMWECPEVVNAAEAALTTLSMSSYIPDLPPPHEDLLHPPELAVEWPELELPNFGESSNSNKLFVDPEIVLHALAANERVQNLSGLHQEEILRRLGAEWTVELALKNSVESTQEIIRADATSPWIKISPALMHIDNHSLASVSRTSRDVVSLSYVKRWVKVPPTPRLELR
ncbi:cellular morphogenesis-like protein [Rhizoctonia solani]|uniref:Cellular morphogenesis-like protein n=1 Tax=Rhizoctonia solani TaxID=456999 RepID=A0A8H8NLE5_9AGAM|nr:cellular morphogenesis-like protein [Rhizoctonia solani]QRW15916.1 cellular morphogenesis-like protein [Rhizoctonia solani]